MEDPLYLYKSILQWISLPSLFPFGGDVLKEKFKMWRKIYNYRQMGRQTQINKNSFHLLLCRWAKHFFQPFRGSVCQNGTRLNLRTIPTKLPCGFKRDYIRERPFNLGGGYGFFLKIYSDSQCCWKKYSDFGGRKRKSDSELLSYNLML